MIKIYKDNKGEIYILNGEGNEYNKHPRELLSGFRLSDAYWRNYHYRNLEEVKSIIIDNTKNKSIKSSWGKSIDIEILVPKFKSNIPHFIIKSLNGKRIVTKKSVYVNILSALKSEKINQDGHALKLNEEDKLEENAPWEITEVFIKKNYKKINTIKLRSSN